MRLIDADAFDERVRIAGGMSEEELTEDFKDGVQVVLYMLSKQPTAQPERDTPKRVMWTGWKGHRYTRYNCPNCKKPVRNNDVYCHRCGQRLMFPKVSHTPYVEGQKQEAIVMWEDEVTT